MKSQIKPIQPILFCLFLFLVPFEGKTQEKLAPDEYLVRFKDKKDSKYHIAQPSEFLSARALLRRQRQDIPIRDNDLPVNQNYIDSLRKLGFKILNQSKWLNAVSVETKNSWLLEKLQQISFVESTKKNSTLKSSQSCGNKFKYTSTAITSHTSGYYGASYEQVSKHHGDFLHRKGFRGQGMLIAVIDAGFLKAQGMSCLDSLWLENRVILARDIYGETGNLYNGDEHGAMVLSVMASTESGYLVGTAPKAEYVLLRSEDATEEPNGEQREYLIEEFNWVVAAELADSIGADIISTSLGYSTFNDPTMDHTYQDLDGQTTLISKGAAMASSKGMIVVVSAGNEGSDTWKYITAPADADSILAVGAIDSKGKRANFSSLGPTFDSRIKPDVMAIGAGTVLQTPDNIIERASGTSFAAPVIAGLTACLWQSAPKKSSFDIIKVIKQYSSTYTSPDNYMGYGIPDFQKAYFALFLLEREDNEELLIWPNPFDKGFSIALFIQEERNVSFSVFDCTGHKILEKEEAVTPQMMNRIVVKELVSFPRGMYLVQLFQGTKKLECKVLKL